MIRLYESAEKEVAYDGYGPAAIHGDEWRWPECVGGTATIRFVRDDDGPMLAVNPPIHISDRVIPALKLPRN